MDFSPRPMIIPKIKFGDLELLSMKETKFLGINLDNNKLGTPLQYPV